MSYTAPLPPKSYAVARYTPPATISSHGNFTSLEGNPNGDIAIDGNGNIRLPVGKRFHIKSLFHGTITGGNNADVYIGYFPSSPSPSGGGSGGPDGGHTITRWYPTNSTLTRTCSPCNVIITTEITHTTRTMVIYGGGSGANVGTVTEAAVLITEM